jgi:hypothetical protein
MSPQTVTENSGSHALSEDTSGRIRVGVQKLAQRWALEFLTEIGSMPGKPKRGCDFMGNVRRGELRTQKQVVWSFLSSNLDVERNLKQEEYATMPTDEQFASATLTSVVFYPGYLELHVMITSVAGEARAAILPIETLP